MRNKNNTFFCGRTACVLVLACTALTLSSCGKNGKTAETTAAAETTVQTTAAETVKETTAAAETAQAAGETASVGRPAEYSEQQKAAEQALAAAQAAAPYHDEDFRKNAGKGMEARWTVLDSTDPKGMSPEEYKKYAADSIQAEIDAFGDFYLYSFTDPDTEQAAGRYMNALASQMQGVMEISDPAELGENRTYMTGYWLRILAIHDLAETGKIPVSEKYQPDLDALLEQYETAKEMMGAEN